MALFIDGMHCPLCRRAMEPHQGQAIRMVRPFVSNRRDPLWLFHDGAFHEECFAQHPLAATVDRCLAQLAQRTHPWPPLCVACGVQVAREEELFSFGLLTTEPDDPLYAFNFLQWHCDCLRQWPDVERVRSLIEALRGTNTWEGAVLDQVLESLSEAVTAE